MIGLWKVGRTIGKGSSGMSLKRVLNLPTSIYPQVASASHDTPRQANTPPSRSSPNNTSSTAPPSHAPPTPPNTCSSASNAKSSS